MPTGLFDIATRSPVFTPQEIQESAQRAYATLGPHAAEGINAAAAGEVQKWNRAAATGKLIDRIKEGFGPRFDTTPDDYADWERWQ